MMRGLGFEREQQRAQQRVNHPRYFTGDLVLAGLSDHWDRGLAGADDSLVWNFHFEAADAMAFVFVMSHQRPPLEDACV